MCDGAEYDKTSLVYQRLFNAIGFKYGTGSTGDMFRVPDFQGRVAVGRGAHADVDAMGDSDGLPVGTRSVKHGHTVTDPGHVHGVEHWSQLAGGAETTFEFQVSGSETLTGTANVKTAGTGVTVGPGGTPVDGPAFLVVNKIISLGS
jgi:microcystin-dependent protein